MNTHSTRTAVIIGASSGYSSLLLQGRPDKSFERFRNGRSTRTSRSGMRWSLSFSSSCRDPV